jgi:predicted Zn-dependent protease
MKLIALLSAVTFVAVGCGVMGGGETVAKKEQPAAQSDEQKATDSADKKEQAPERQPAQTVKFNLEPDREILPAFVGPRMSLDNGDAGVDLPEDRAGLLKAARKALRERKIDFALAIIDVLNLMNPDDPEILELRGDTLMEQGFKEDAMADLDKCCSLGRSTCCR